MSHGPLPEYVDARKAFSPDTSVSGSIGLNRLPRVAACLADDSGQVRASLGFAIDGFGRRRIAGEIHASLPMICQRCLEANQAELVEAVDLVLVNDEAEAQALDKSLEPWLADDYRIVLADLVEEQLLLGMPIVNFHVTGPCSERDHYSTEVEEADRAEEQLTGQQNPFAVLAKLKQD